MANASVSSVSRRQLRLRSRQLQETVRQTYEADAYEYLSRAPKHVTAGMKTWIDASIHELPTDSRVFEIGSATGRDADYIESHGLNVQRSDISAPFIELLSERGHLVAEFDVLQDRLPDQMDLIFANAVVCHFNVEQFALFLDKCHLALSSAGRLAFSTKSTPGSYRATYRNLGSTRRPFFSWPKDSLMSFVTQRGFTVEFCEVADAISSPNPWVNVVAAKSPHPISTLF